MLGCAASLILLLLVLASHAAGQEKNPGPRISFQHDGQGVTGYALYVRPEGGQEQRFDLGYLVPDSTGMVSAPLPKLPPGRYALEIAAYNPAGESPRVAASPSRLTVAASKPASRPAEPAAPRPAGAAAQPPAPAPSTPAESPPTKPRPTSKWGRFWVFLVGED